MGILSKGVIDSKKYSILPLYHPSPISPTGHKNNLKIFKDNEEDLNRLFK